MHILITGANGFIGNALCEKLVGDSFHVTAVVRGTRAGIENVNFTVMNLTSETDWQAALTGVDVVIHLAGRAHVMKETEKKPSQIYEAINVDVTKRLAEQAALLGVKRFIFLSSIGVVGNQSRWPFSESDQVNPQELYAKSKKKAEDVLRSIASTSRLEVVIVRPPLVYGPGAKGNFEKLINLCSLKVPLPFGAICNKRSLVYIENLVDFISTCITHPQAANQTFLISDDDDVSTTSLLQNIIKFSGAKTHLISIPQSILRILFKFIGKHALYIKICGDLQVDINKAKTLLGWRPLFSFEEGIKKTMLKSK